MGEGRREASLRPGPPPSEGVNGIGQLRGWLTPQGGTVKRVAVQTALGPPDGALGLLK